MLVEDIIKINYIREGYLSDNPYHLISETELYRAFIGDFSADIDTTHEVEYRDNLHDIYVDVCDIDTSNHVDHVVIRIHSNSSLSDVYCPTVGVDCYDYEHLDDNTISLRTSSTSIPIHSMPSGEYQLTVFESPYQYSTDISINFKLTDGVLYVADPVSTKYVPKHSIWVNMHRGEWYESCYFLDNYKCPSNDFIDRYHELVSNIRYHLFRHVNPDKYDPDPAATYDVPTWVFSYMLHTVISNTSNELDKHDLFVLLGTDNLYDNFDERCAASCYSVSQTWLSKLPPDQLFHRCPTMFGEPHVSKYLRTVHQGGQ